LRFCKFLEAPRMDSNISFSDAEQDW
jgi:hypothetical protein